jgi:hypothetical protein
MIVTGKKLYRLNFSEDLQEPQAEIDFEELMAFLIDRGAKPDVKGLHMLRLAGLWTPTGTSLLLGPDGSESALKVSIPDDSDGVLSLALNWKRAWDRRDGGSLPPAWIRLRNYDSQKPPPTGEQEKKAQEEGCLVDEISSAEKSGKEVLEQGEIDQEKLQKDYKIVSSTTSTSIRIHIGVRAGALTIDSAIYESNLFPVPGPGPDINHVQRPSAATWIPPLATALGQFGGHALWTAHIPPPLITLAAAQILPCGVCVLLGIVDEADAPAWATPHNPLTDNLRQSERFFAQQARIRAENSLPPAQRAAARSLREAEERFAFGNEAREMMNRRREREEKRDMEALNSSRLDTAVVAAAAVAYLKKHDGIESAEGLEQRAEELLYRMIVDEAKAETVCAMLQRWSAWTDRGGLNKEDLVALKADVVSFCDAVCWMGIVKMVGAQEESSLALDMQECIRVWKNVKLG